jgi:hypothetical protein
MPRGGGGSIISQVDTEGLMRRGGCVEGSGVWGKRVAGG